VLAAGRDQEVATTPSLNLDEGIGPHESGLFECSSTPGEPHQAESSVGDQAFSRSGSRPELPAELLAHPRYQILQLLGLGGMGAVYKAEHRLMSRLVALKVINRELIKGASAVPRFRQEVRAAARLAHPNIVTAFDAEEAGGCHFLVMEYVEGVNLARLVEVSGPLTVERTAALLRQAALGLQHAHAQGMVHRDIKPHNLMLTPQGQVKILDFGVARFASDQGRQASEAAATEHRLTLVGEVVGTPDYLAPEQARNACGVDTRADLYSLGCTAYFLLTGKVPFPAETALQKLFLHWEKEPEPLEDLRPELPLGLVQVVRTLMAKRPEDRYQTAAEAAAAFEPFTTPPTVPPPCPAPEPPPLVASSEEPPSPPVLPPAPAPTEKELPPPLPQPVSLPAAGRSLFPAVCAVVVGLLAALGFAVVRNALSRQEEAPSAQEGKDSSTPDASPRDRPRVLFLLAPKRFARDEYVAVRQALEEAGVEVVSTAFARQTHSHEPGAAPLAVDVRLAEVRPADFDGLVVGGGDGAREYTGSGKPADAARRLLAELMQGRKPVAAIGMGTCVLADTGVLRGKRVACPPAARLRVHEAGCEVVAAPIIVLGPAAGHGSLITARDARAVADFTRALLRSLPLEDNKQKP
jgi:serine/threonine-protein kinase